MEAKNFDFSKCRFCGDLNLIVYLDLGNLCLTGFFPSPGEEVPKLPLSLARCGMCGLTQLAHKIPVEQLYNSGYGYESHLNSQMKTHLFTAAKQLQKMFKIRETDSVLDIASNDGTMLSGYDNTDIEKYGIDPLALTLTDAYPAEAVKIPKFFSAEAVMEITDKKFNLITSFSVFYDLDSPADFVSSIEMLLAEDGVWVLEQSYFYSMIETLSFDTICHEHLLYLRLKDIDNLLAETNLEVFDVELNETNGGSFRVFVKRKESERIITPFVSWLRQKELIWEREWDSSIESFGQRVINFKFEFTQLLFQYQQAGRSIVGFGASTKGNALLQYCELDSKIIEFILEINPKKIGKVTPGSNIPIWGEEEFRRKIDRTKEFLGVVLPWHLYDSVLAHKSANIEKMTFKEFVLPLPRSPIIIRKF